MRASSSDAEKILVTTRNKSATAGDCKMGLTKSDGSWHKARRQDHANHHYHDGNDHRSLRVLCIYYGNVRAFEAVNRTNDSAVIEKVGYEARRRLTGLFLLSRRHRHLLDPGNIDGPLS